MPGLRPSVRSEPLEKGCQVRLPSSGSRGVQVRMEQAERDGLSEAVTRATLLADWTVSVDRPRRVAAQLSDAAQAARERGAWRAPRRSWRW